LLFVSKRFFFSHSFSFPSFPAFFFFFSVLKMKASYMLGKGSELYPQAKILLFCTIFVNNNYIPIYSYQGTLSFLRLLTLFQWYLLFKVHVSNVIELIFIQPLSSSVTGNSIRMAFIEQTTYMQCKGEKLLDSAH
jgi:hypothetical protein